MEGVWEAAASSREGSIDLLKHQFLPLTGNTTNLALMILQQKDFGTSFFLIIIVVIIIIIALLFSEEPLLF